MKVAFAKNVGFIFLAIYLILIGLSAVIPGLGVPMIILGVLALVIRIFLLLGI